LSEFGSIDAAAEELLFEQEFANVRSLHGVIEGPARTGATAIAVTTVAHEVLRGRIRLAQCCATLFELRAALDDFELRGACAALVDVAGRIPADSTLPELVWVQAILERMSARQRLAQSPRSLSWISSNTPASMPFGEVL